MPFQFGQDLGGDTLTAEEPPGVLGFERLINPRIWAASLVTERTSNGLT
jgi:hypothetical protein